MNYNEEPSPSPRQPVLPPLSNRTLHHPSFLPLYMSAGSAHHHSSFNTQTVLPIIPPELFYTDPTMHCGRRIPNTVSQFRSFDRFQLNTPPPVMSASLAPPNRPDPFRSGTHSIRDLGSSSWRIHIIHPTTQPSWVVLQLTQEEDQAITNLLKLHHHEPLQRDETLTALHMDSSGLSEPLVDNMDTSSLCSPSECTDPTLVEELDDPFYSDPQHPMEAGLMSQVQQERRWSDVELEAADTLLSRFSLTEEDKLRVQTQQGCEALIPARPTQNHVGYVGFSRVREDGGWTEVTSVEGRNTDDIPKEYPASSSLVTSGSIVFGDLSGVKDRKLSDSEGDAVRGLLSLGDM
ncbi:uncharacterized protein LOC122973422 isoform X1 [Thunnus albacares]|uniref:uncharacterized protein LOC122973422 isoform X1 n=1 Tax=Thunnus albacares TaxID=8236 RepID=UPI001CF6E6AD|nr:uncharacterized protein LOC122973422 isoform X1 [Thunnus albacares]